MDLKPLKGIYPFRLGTTSYIYPADYVANVQRLAPFLDEIELLLFESTYASLPSSVVVSELGRLAVEKQVTYNVHLPLDIDLGATDTAARHQAVNALAVVMERVQPLLPTSYTLHLGCHIHDFSSDKVAAWQNRTAQSLSHLFKETAVPGRQICIETLDYPPKWFLPLLDPFDLSVCLDIGHIVRFGYAAIEDIFSNFLHRTQIFHLHGVRQGKDHLALNHLDQEVLHKLAAVLSGFSGSVSLEVFSLEHLKQSMHCLARMLGPDQTLQPEDR
jgi:sugar phosphate isomerase/epimerase